MLTEEDVRELALALPRTTEKSSYGTPGFRVADRLFARVLEDGERVVVFTDEREALVRSDPVTFTVPPHYADHPMVVIAMASVDRQQLHELLTDSWRLRAPAKVRAAYDP